MTSNPLLRAWEDLGIATLALDTAADADAIIPERIEALRAAIGLVINAVHVLLRHAAGSPAEVS